MYVTDLQLSHLDTFCINSKMNSYLTIAVIIEGLIFAGGNEGSIYLFKLNQQVFFFLTYVFRLYSDI